MTNPAGQYWIDGVNVYLQPQVINPPNGQNANNARHAVWHLGRALTIEVYPSGDGQYRAGDLDPVDDGRFDRGAARLVTVYGVIAPESGGSIAVQQAFEGERTEGSMMLTLDSHQPENIAAAQANADIFPDGIRIIGSDMVGTDDRHNFATVIRFRGRRWKVLTVAEHWEGGDEELHTEGALYRCTLGLLRDQSHERDAVPGMVETAPVWGPE